LQLLKDLQTYEEWRPQYGAHLATGIAWCQLKLKRDAGLAKDAFANITEAQLADLPDESYYSDLLY
jgi:hypothetical protein